MSRILIVEDDEAFRAVLQQTLERAGHTVLQAPTGLAAMALLKRERVDVVLTDIVMPDQDGLGLLLMMRGEKLTTPVIVMSGGLANSAAYLEIARKLGARRLLAKPFTPEQLFEALRDV